jgi:5-methylcytosine-specific restriction protein B
VTNTDDPRFALTLREDQRLLRLDFGNWAVLQFYNFSSFYRVGIALIADQVRIEGNLRTWEPFAHSKPEIRIYDLPIELIRPFNEELRKIHEKTFAHIATRFQKWTASNYRKFNQTEIAEAVFDLGKREKLFNEGLSKEIGNFVERETKKSFDIMSPTPTFEELSKREIPAEKAINQIFPLLQLAEETGFDEAELARWVRAIERKGQAILYGPPGTGKTFVAEKLAAHLIGGGDGFFDLVQFHPAYAYEDFVQGIRPQSEGDHLSYPVVPGRFLEFCAEASQRRERCVLIIDEINRANLSRVFGELMYLLEYRERAIPLAGGGFFKIPANVRLIGTMNTADRSIALVDHALRRRFAFLALYPNYDLLRRYHQRQQTGFSSEGLISILQRLNQQINDPHYAVGVTYFLTQHLADELEDIWRMEIEPYLEEYFFDQPGKVADFRWDTIKQKVAL